jgi:hypothetical protein
VGLCSNTALFMDTEVCISHFSFGFIFGVFFFLVGRGDCFVLFGSTVV